MILSPFRNPAFHAGESRVTSKTANPKPPPGIDSTSNPRKPPPPVAICVVAVLLGESFGNGDGTVRFALEAELSPVDGAGLVDFLAVGDFDSALGAGNSCDSISCWGLSSPGAVRPSGSRTLGSRRGSRSGSFAGSSAVAGFSLPFDSCCF